MSSEGPGLKAGHPPAVKAGGMRVVTKHKPPEKEDPDAYDQKYQDQLPEQPNIGAIAGTLSTPKGVVETTDVETVKAFHSKPQPKLEKAHSPNKKQMHINQPRK